MNNYFCPLFVVFRQGKLTGQGKREKLAMDVAKAEQKGKKIKTIEKRAT